jgi:AcrR family transcriptional regulator
MGEAAGRRATARRELVEQELYEHAARLFAERGFAGTSLQDIADALGVTRPALYYYVRSKDELLAGLVTEVASGPLDELHALAARDTDPVRRLRGVVETIVELRVRRPDRFRLLLRSEAELPTELAAAYEESSRATLAVVADVIEEGVRTRRFRPVDARVAALGVLGMCNGVAWWFRTDGPDSAEGVTRQLADIAVAGLLGPDQPAPLPGGPAAAISLLRRDLDRLERALDL